MIDSRHTMPLVATSIGSTATAWVAQAQPYLLAVATIVAIVSGILGARNAIIDHRIKRLTRAKLEREEAEATAARLDSQRLP